MSQQEEAGQSQRYCRNCGAEVRSGNAFCVSCGASIAAEGEWPGQAHSSSAHRQSPAGAALGEALWGMLRRFGRSRTYSDDALRNALRNLLWRVKDLPIGLKVAGAVVGVLLLLTILSPLGLVTALFIFGVSIITLIVRVRQHRSVKRLRIIAVTSLVLMLVFAGASNAFYGKEETAGKGSSSTEVDAKGKGVAHESVAPELKGIAEAWRSSSREEPFLFPSYLPLPVTEVENITEGLVIKRGVGHQINFPPSKCIFGERGPGCANSVSLVLGQGSSAPPDLPTVEIDGERYHVDESEIHGLSDEFGLYTAILWIPSGDKFYPFEVSLFAHDQAGSPLSPEAYIDMVSSLKRINPSGSERP